MNDTNRDFNITTIEAVWPRWRYGVERIPVNIRGARARHLGFGASARAEAERIARSGILLWVKSAGWTTPNGASGFDSSAAIFERGDVAWDYQPGPLLSHAAFVAEAEVFGSSGQTVDEFYEILAS